MNAERTNHMVWEWVEPLRNQNTGAINKDGFWKCTKTTCLGRENAEAWARMPITDGGYCRKSVVVEIQADAAIMLQDRAIPDEAFSFAVLRLDRTNAGIAA